MSCCFCLSDPTVQFYASLGFALVAGLSGTALMSLYNSWLRRQIEMRRRQALTGAMGDLNHFGISMPDINRRKDDE